MYKCDIYKISVQINKYYHKYIMDTSMTIKEKINLEIINIYYFNTFLRESNDETKKIKDIQTHNLYTISLELNLQQKQPVRSVIKQNTKSVVKSLNTGQNPII